MIDVGIVGCGVVGGTLKLFFEETTDHSIFIYDPEKGYTDNLDMCEVCFICVPVPTVGFKQYHSILEDAISRCPKTSTVFIRSTVLPGINDQYGTYSLPEFLTERFAYDEMLRLPIITGCPKITLLTKLFPNKEIMIMSNVEAELSKYAHNCFGAMKVNYFNIINEIAESIGADYKTVLDGVLSTGFISEQHTQVPGPDGKFGYGGKCFPPNMTSFFGMFPYPEFSAAINSNESFREKDNSSMVSERFSTFREINSREQ